MENILITGANGQLGSELKVLSNEYKNFNYYFTDIEELDITKKSDIDVFCKKNKINIIINCAAYTAVDLAESEIELSNLINAEAPKIITEIAIKKEIKVIHISTDYVFDGKNFKPYSEDDATNPTSQYGKSKLNGETNILQNPNSIIIRTSWLYSSFGKNFVKTILNLTKNKKELRVISDQIGSPTYANDLAKAILKILSDNKFISGIYNYSNQGVASWYDFAFEIIKIKKLKNKIVPILTKDYPTPAARPFYSVLDKNKIVKTYNFDIPNWRDSLYICIKKLMN